MHEELETCDSVGHHAYRCDDVSLKERPPGGEATADASACFVLGKARGRQGKHEPRSQRVSVKLLYDITKQQEPAAYSTLR